MKRYCVQYFNLLVFATMPLRVCLAATPPDETGVHGPGLDMDQQVCCVHSMLRVDQQVCCVWGIVQAGVA